jgi:hypothetical protein
VAATSAHEMGDLASAIVERVKERLADASYGRVRVETCIHYGAIDISPKYLVVWVLLAGAQDDELPEWFKPGAPVDHPGRNQNLDPALLVWLDHLQQAVRDEFAAARWPGPEKVDVLFDSEHRVREGGGFWYFK